VWKTITSVEKARAELYMGPDETQKAARAKHIEMINGVQAKIDKTPWLTSEQAKLNELEARLMRLENPKRKNGCAMAGAEFNKDTGQSKDLKKPQNVIVPPKPLPKLPSKKS
jgi:hypothetical protein